MSRRVTGTPGDRGISLIEMVIAVLILAIGVTAGFRSLAQARVGIGGELPRLIAREVALNIAEEAQLLGAGAGQPETITMAGRDWRVDVAQAPTQAGFVELRIRVADPDGLGALVTAYAPQEPPE